ncbi:DUF4129 domain-containing protein [Thermobifida halotolerans]|uniref:DUF4129 domain-containing protein n=1 Tax=Thermobifida halotolerans TaxID=483545 RepID=A0AA97M1B2_9ACTN|nr:DUF4129 domain-containing protein [Thermobifida halotolerans]UOE22072.1 DUF4129 domain-containing protein [Thermobifida halotolerans]
MVSRDEGARIAWDELSDPVYGEAQPSLLERLLQWFDDRLEDLLGRAEAALPGGWWTLGALLVVLALLVAALIWYLRPGRVSRRAAPLDSSAEMTADDHRGLAERHAARGAYAEAIRERLRAVVRDLEDRAVISPRLGRTATELAAEASAVLPERRAELHRAAALFNDVWYGDREATSEGYGLLCALDDALRSAVPSTPAEPPR